MSNTPSNHENPVSPPPKPPTSPNPVQRPPTPPNHLQRPPASPTTPYTPPTTEERDAQPPPTEEPPIPEENTPRKPSTRKKKLPMLLLLPILAYALFSPSETDTEHPDTTQPQELAPYTEETYQAVVHGELLEEEEVAVSDPNPLLFAPQVTDMLKICELSVIETRYNNVAKYLEKGQGLFAKDVHFWVEYTGIVKIGIDMAHVNIFVEDDQVTIHLPTPMVLTCKVDETSLNENSYFYALKSKDADAAVQVKAISYAQTDLYLLATKDRSLLNSAQERVQLLLKEYVQNIGELTQIDYNISWVYLDAKGNAL